APLSGDSLSGASSAPPLAHKQFSRVHDPVGIKRTLEAAHQVELNALLVMFQLFQARLAHAVLCADGAAEIGDDIVNDAIDMRSLLVEAGGIPVEWAHGVVMDVAIANMAKRALTHAGTSCGEGRIGALDELGDAGDGHGYIVGDAAACGLLSFDQAFPHPP